MTKIIRGALDFFFRRDLWVDADRGFNGQAYRQKIFASLVQAQRFRCIIETGTFRGVTTEYMHRHSLCPIYTVEQHPRYFGFSLVRLLFKGRVHQTLRDSVTFLRDFSVSLANEGDAVLFYLDAHWDKPLPLREELKIIAQRWPKAVVLIDDFQVPNDSGYAYDDYGPGEALTLEYIAASNLPSYAAFFPRAASSEETGSKRGCVVLAFDVATIDLLSKNEHLRRHR